MPRPFHCGSQFGDWVASNCDRCTKDPCGEGDDHKFGRCDIADALAHAFFGDGEVSEDIAKRMNLPGNEKALVWMCNEVEWTEEWEKKFEEKNGPSRP